MARRAKTYAEMKAQYTKRVRDFMEDFYKTAPQLNAVPLMRIKQFLHHSSASSFLETVLAALAADGLVTGLEHMHETGYVYFTERFLEEMKFREQEGPTFGS